MPSAWLCGSFGCGVGPVHGMVPRRFFFQGEQVTWAEPGNQSPTPQKRTVARRFRAAVQQQLRQDWARVGEDIRLDAGVPLPWLRGRKPEMDAATFAARWGGLVSHARHPPALVVNVPDPL